MRVITLSHPCNGERHCDTRCHNSTKKACNCICGGLLHGYGEAYAKQNAARTSMYVARIAGPGSMVILATSLVPDF